MKHYSVLSILAGISLFACTSIAYAQSVDVPRTISYQGAVTSTDGSPLFDAEHSITVTLYADPDGTFPIWQDTYSTTTTKGIFNLYLGSNKPLPASAQMNRPLWVGTTINGGEEMRPLTPLTASPYALNLPDHTVTTDKLADGAVTAEKVEMDYVRGFRVNGQEVSGKGTVLDIRSTNDVTVNYDQATNSVTIGTVEEGRNVARSDAEKGAAVLDQTDGSENWTGRFYSPGPVPNPLVFQTPVGSYNTLAGGFANMIGASSLYAGIAAGRDNYIGPNDTASFIGGGDHNSITQDYSTIGGGGGLTRKARGGGDGNLIRSQYGTIGGGRGNWIDTLAHDATIAGGIGNTVSRSPYVDSYITDESGGAIGGGGGNIVVGYYGTVAGGHHNEAIGNFSFVGGGGHATHGPGGNLVKGDYSAIVGGETNAIDTLAHHSIIGGGGRNRINTQSNWGVIGGGDTNHIDQQSNWGVIAGGLHNTISYNTNFSVISGGDTNLIDNNSLNGVIGGGSNNIINSGSGSGTIGGGELNVIGSGTIWSTIAGGHGNMALHTHATIGGGHYNTVTENGGSIIGGTDNTVNGLLGTVGGGAANRVDGEYSAILGGEGNTVATLSHHSIIGGGDHNTIDQQSNWGVVAGGDNNAIDLQSNWGVIAGGTSNYIATLTEKGAIGGGMYNRLLSGANGSVIGGGESNTIDVNSAHSVVGGGSQNSVTGFDNVLGGGLQNIVRANAATISGGVSNTVDGYNSQINGGRENTVTAGGHTGIIVGGHMNRVEAMESFVGGGRENKVLTNAKKSTIGGGEANEIRPDASYSTVGGGFKNVIDAAALTDPSFLSATIPGGDNLIAQSWAQTVIGGWNLPKGDVSSRYVAGSRKSPIFIVGNGFADPNRSNAFEVSYNGHSTVYHQNGTGTIPAQAAIRGTTYTDNVVYAWATATPAPGHVDIGCDFGVQNIAYLGLGHYRITMNLEKPEDNGTFTPMNLSCGSVTATIVVPFEEPTCASINTTAINGNTFDIYISRNVLVISPQGVPSLECQHMDLPFTFKVTGRPI